MTADELLALAESLETQASEMYEALNLARPYSTREQWMAWESLTSAARAARSAAIWLLRHDEKYGKK